MKFQEVPYVKLSAMQKRKALEIVGKGNTLLKKWSAFFPSKKYRVFRNAVMEGSKNPKFNGQAAIPADKLCEFHKDLPEMTAIRHKKLAELDNRSAEQALLEGFSALAKRHAKKWSLEGDPVGLTKQDFLQEAYMQVIEAIYAWLPDAGGDISTYIWWSLKNRMSNVANQQGNMFCPLTNADLELMSRFDKKKRGMDYNATFDQIVNELGLSSEEGKHLNGILTRVFTENHMFSEQRADEHADSDYTMHRAGIDSETGTEQLIASQYVKDVIGKADLTKIERELIEMAMESNHGWQTEFSKKYADAEWFQNPKTGKPFTRMGVTLMLRSAREKLSRVIDRQKRQEAA
jgi:hypothetical protein